MIRRYKSSVVLKVLSLGFCNSAISIAAGVMWSTYGFYAFKRMRIDKITMVRYCEIEGYYDGSVITYYTVYEFYVKGEKHVS